MEGFNTLKLPVFVIASFYPVFDKPALRFFVARVDLEAVAFESVTTCLHRYPS